MPTIATLSPATTSRGTDRQLPRRPVDPTSCPRPVAPTTASCLYGHIVRIVPAGARRRHDDGRCAERVAAEMRVRDRRASSDHDQRPAAGVRPAHRTRATCHTLLSALEAEPAQLILGSHGAVVATAVAGLGVTMVSEQAVAQHVQAGRLAVMTVPGTPLERPWHPVTGEGPTATTELLVRHILERPEWSAIRASIRSVRPGLSVNPRSTDLLPASRHLTSSGRSPASVRTWAHAAGPASIGRIDSVVGVARTSRRSRSSSA